MLIHLQNEARLIGFQLYYLMARSVNDSKSHEFYLLNEADRNCSMTNVL